MKNLKMKWALMVAFAIPGLAVNSCWTMFLMEMRDAAVEGVGDFTQDTTFDLLDTFVDLDGDAE